MLPVHHLPPFPTHGSDLSSKKSRSTFNCPISWYSRAISAASLYVFLSRPLLNIPTAPSFSAFFRTCICPGRTSYRAASSATVSSPLTSSRATLTLKAALCFLLPFLISHSFSTASAASSQEQDSHIAASPVPRVHLNSSMLHNNRLPLCSCLTCTNIEILIVSHSVSVQRPQKPVFNGSSRVLTSSAKFSRGCALEVFISWSGDRSEKVAEALRDWLPSVIQSVRPFMSASDIEKGSRWSNDLAMHLENAQFGLICLTQENLKAPWLIFEAGALSKSIENSRVAPYLYGVSQAQLQGPLAQFQASIADKDSTLEVVKSIRACSHYCG